MPTLLRWNGFRFYFFSNEGSEPPHIHVDKAEFSAKFWLNPVRLAENHGFPYNEIIKLEKKIIENQTEFENAWNEYFRS